MNLHDFQCFIQTPFWGGTDSIGKDVGDMGLCPQRGPGATKFLCVKTSSGNVLATSFPYLTVHRSIEGDVPIYVKLAFKVTHPFSKRRFQKLLFSCTSTMKASLNSDIFCDRNLTQRISFLAIITYGDIRRESPPARVLK